MKDSLHREMKRLTVAKYYDVHEYFYKINDQVAVLNEILT